MPDGFINRHPPSPATRQPSPAARQPSHRAPQIALQISPQYYALLDIPIQGGRVSGLRPDDNETICPFDAFPLF